MEYKEIIDRLIGNIHSIGSSHIDCERYENLKEYCGLACEMINEICDEAKNSKRFEYSMEKSGKEAIEYLKCIKVTIDYCLNHFGE